MQASTTASHGQLKEPPLDENEPSTYNRQQAAEKGTNSRERPLLYILALSLKWSWVLLGALVFLTISCLSIALVGALLVWLPANYFSESRSRGFWLDAHPVLRWTGLILKNIIGAAVVVLGILLSMPGVPGPGILIILLGITLMDFPGKRRLEWWLISRPTVLVAVNRLRRRCGKGPFVLQDSSGENIPR